MQLTRHTDFSLRVLIYLSLQNKDTLITIEEISKHFNILKNHLTKVVHQLALKGYIKTVRGKNGGMTLAKPPKQINLGEIIQSMENKTDVIDCKGANCPLTNNCELKDIFNEAQNAFFSTLDKYSLADISKTPENLQKLLNFTAQI